MQSAEHDQEQRKSTSDAVHQPEGEAHGATQKFTTAGTVPAVQHGAGNAGPSASDRAYVVNDIATARERGDEELVIQIVKRVLELARTSEPHVAAQLIEQLYASGVDLQYPAVAYAIRDTLAVVQQKQNVTDASGVAHGAATTVTGTTNPSASKQQPQPQPQAQQQHDAGATTTHDAGATTTTQQGAQAHNAGPARNSQGEEIAGGPDAKQGVHVGGNDAHPDGVKEGMLIDGWRVYATTARKIHGTQGTIAWQDNNPGNLTVEPSHINDGGMFGDYKYTDGTFRVFPTYAAGRAAIAKYFRAWQHRKPDITLEDVVHFYGNQTDASRKIYRDKWTHAAGVPNTTKIEDLSDAQLEAITVAIVGQEGTVPGIELPRTDPKLPDGVYTGTR